MNHKQVVALTRTVAAACPQQTIDDYTPDAWFDLLGDLDFEDATRAVAAVAKRQPFVAPAEIRAEVKRIRSDRLARTPLPAPPAELADDTARYQRAVRAAVKRIADGTALHRAIAGAPLPGEPPPTWREARKALDEPAVVKPDPQQVAREQAEEARAERERRERAS